MAYGVIIPNYIQATKVNTLNRSVKAAYDVENGSVFSLSFADTTGEGEVFACATPATGFLTSLWMAYEPEVVTTVSGSYEFKGIDPDVRNFKNLTGKVFSAFKPKVYDIITMSADALAGTKNSNTFVVGTVGASKLTWAASAISGLSLKLMKTNYISIGNPALANTQRVTSYMFEVVAE